jgi:purine-binding chemotaxis protein CheW
MSQRNTGQLWQTTSRGLQRQGETATGESLGSDPQRIARSIPGNVLDPKDLATVQAEAVVVGEQYLVFSLLGCELALKAEYIHGVERLADVTPIPNVAPWISGVINLRGSIVSVVDLRAFLDMESLPYNPRTRLLSVKYNEMLICLIVDSVSEMISIPPSAINNKNMRQANIPQWLAPYASGSALVGRRMLVLLDAARLLFSEKMQHYS